LLSVKCNIIDQTETCNERVDMFVASGKEIEGGVEFCEYNIQRTCAGDLIC